MRAHVEKLFYLLLLAAPVLELRSANLLADPDFKETAAEGKPSAWTFSKNWERVADSPKGDGASMKTNKKGDHISQNVTLKGGTDYWLTFYCKRDGEKNSRGVVDLLTEDNKKFFEFSFDTIQKWREIRLLLPLVTATQKMKLRVCNWEGESLLFSGANLEELPRREGLKDFQILDFEIDSDLEGTTQPCGKLCRLERSPDFASKGNFSLKVSYPNTAMPVLGFWHLDKRDLFGYKSLSCDIFNPSDKDASTYPVLEANWEGVPHASLWARPVQLKAKEKTHLELNIYEWLNAANNKKDKKGEYFLPQKELKTTYFYFGLIRLPGERTVYYIDNIRLNAY